MPKKKQPELFSRKGNPQRTKKCEHCAKSFRTRNVNKKYCSKDCKKSAKNARFYQKMLTSEDSYPNLWKRGLIQEKVRLRANHRCEQCDMEFVEGTNLAVDARNKNGHPTIGTVHHIDMDKSNNTKRNLVFLCQRCHFTIHLYDWKPGQIIPLRWKNNLPKWIVQRGFEYIPHSQFALFGGDS